MIQSPIVKVLSTIREHGVKALLMGGQACIFYGAAEFSKDADIVLLAEAENVDRLRAALAELKARQRYVPALDLDALERGHGIHFTCAIAEPQAVRLDVMSKLRGVDSFELLWTRRTTFQDHDGNIYDVLGLEDLVKAKKTRRAKDWPMVARLLEANYIENFSEPTNEQLQFWLREMRTAAYLIQIARAYPEATHNAARGRPLLRIAITGDEAALDDALFDEEREQRRIDREYWNPLLQELERLRRARGG